MKLTWKQIVIAGMAVAVPVIIRIATQQSRDKAIEELRKYKEEMAHCKQCRDLFSGRAGCSFLVHLIDQHKLPFNKADKIVRDLYKNLLIRKGEYDG